MLRRFNTQFRVVHGNTPEVIQTTQAIHHQNYHQKQKFENRTEYSNRLECDAFDGIAVHSLVMDRATSGGIGTARLILPRYAAEGLPIQRMLQKNGFFADDHFPVENAAEVSRYAIVNGILDQPIGRVKETDAGRESENRGILPYLGLLQELLRQSLDLGVIYWAAMMEIRLLRILAAIGVHFSPIGPLISHHALRQPSYCYLPEMLERLHGERPDHWKVVTKAGTLRSSGITI